MSPVRPFSRIDWLLLFGLTVALFLRLASYPASWDSVVGFALFPQVDYVLDQVPLKLSWVWEDMYQHNAGASPVYSALVVPGLRLFGLELIAARLPLALVAWSALTLLYVQVRHWVDALPARLWWVLLGTCSWYLLMARSGGLLSLSLSLVFLVAAGLLALARQATTPQTGSRAAWFGLGAGVGVTTGLLPYGHTSTRLLFLVLVVTVPFWRRRFTGWQRVGFAVGLGLLLLPQLAEPRKARENFFNARGETLLQVAHDNTDGTAQAIFRFANEKLQENVLAYAQTVLGTRQLEHGFFANEAWSYWRELILLFPRWWVPFLFWGVWTLAVAAKRQPQSGSTLLLAYGAVTAAPALLSGLGGPNAARLLLHLPFLAACTATGLSAAATRWPRVARLSLPLVALLVAAQLYNFFGYTKGAEDDEHRAEELWSEVQRAVADYPGHLLIVQEFADFYLESQVHLRWRGGERLTQWMRDGWVVLLNSRSKDLLQATIDVGKPVLLITENPDDRVRYFGERPWTVVKQGGRVTILRPSQAPPP